jgi:hypothetical protein
LRFRDNPHPHNSTLSLKRKAILTASDKAILRARFLNLCPEASTLEEAAHINCRFRSDRGPSSSAQDLSPKVCAVANTTCDKQGPLKLYDQCRYEVPTRWRESEGREMLERTARVCFQMSFWLHYVKFSFCSF